MKNHVSHLLSHLGHSKRIWFRQSRQNKIWILMKRSRPKTHCLRERIQRWTYLRKLGALWTQNLRFSNLATCLIFKIKDCLPIPKYLTTENLWSLKSNHQRTCSLNVVYNLENLGNLSRRIFSRGALSPWIQPKTWLQLFQTSQGILWLHNHRNKG